MARSKLHPPIKHSKEPSSQKKTGDGSDFLPGKLAHWHGYARYNESGNPAVVILIKKIDNRSGMFPLLKSMFDDPSELRWFCHFAERPGDPVLLKQSELEIL